MSTTYAMFIDSINQYVRSFHEKKTLLTNYHHKRILCHSSALQNIGPDLTQNYAFNFAANFNMNTQQKQFKIRLNKTSERTIK